MVLWQAAHLARMVPMRCRVLEPEAVLRNDLLGHAHLFREEESGGQLLWLDLGGVYVRMPRQPENLR